MLLLTVNLACKHSKNYAEGNSLLVHVFPDFYQLQVVIRSQLDTFLVQSFYHLILLVRNAPDCEDPTCQICSFVQLSENSVVLHISTHDVVDGSIKLPFTSRSAWLSIQSECSDLRQTHAHLKQGTCPSKKLTNIKDIQRYLGVSSIGKDGLLVVRRNEPLAPT